MEFVAADEPNANVVVVVEFPPPNGCEIGFGADNPKAGTDEEKVELPNPEILLLFVVVFDDEGVNDSNILDGVMLLMLFCPPPKENAELDGALVVVVIVVD